MHPLHKAVTGLSSCNSKLMRLSAGRCRATTQAGTNCTQSAILDGFCMQHKAMIAQLQLARHLQQRRQAFMAVDPGAALWLLLSC